MSVAVLVVPPVRKSSKTAVKFPIDVFAPPPPAGGAPPPPPPQAERRRTAAASHATEYALNEVMNCLLEMSQF
jgi:hypothetical protein